MKKRVLVGLLLSTMLLFVGCGESDNSNNEVKDNIAQESVEASQETVETSKENESKNENTNLSEVLLDNEVAKVVLTGVENGSVFGPELKVEVENKTDKTIVIQTREVSVDGIMADPVFSCEVAAGKKAKDSISFMSSDIDELKNVEGILHIFDSENWDEIGDYGFSTLASEASESGASTEATNGVVLVDNELVKISYVGQGSDSIMGPELKLEIENKTDSTLTVQSREVSVDGYMIEPIFSCEISAGKKAKDSMTFFEDDVTELKNIEGIFHVFYSDGWDALGDYPFSIEK